MREKNEKNARKNNVNEENETTKLKKAEENDITEKIMNISPKSDSFNYG